MSVQINTPPLLRGLLGIICVIVIFAAMRYSTPVLNPLLIGLLIALLVAPIYQWLRRKLPGWLALIVMIIGLIVFFVFLGYLFARAAESLRTGLSTYATQLQASIDQVISYLESAGLNTGGDSFSSKALVTFLELVIAALDAIVTYIFPVIIVSIFLLIEGGSLWRRAQESLPNNPLVMRLTTFGTSVARQFGIRGIVNAITGTGFALALFLLGVDYAALWGILTFFLSYIPYIGIVLAGAPAVILAFAEYGLDRAILVVLALTVANFTAENLLAPALMGRGLNISTTLTFVGFMFWFWLLGAAGAFLAMPLTILVILVLDSFPQTRWLANVVSRPASPEGSSSPKAKATK